MGAYYDLLNFTDFQKKTEILSKADLSALLLSNFRDNNCACQVPKNGIKLSFHQVRNKITATIFFCFKWLHKIMAKSAKVLDA